MNYADLIAQLDNARAEMRAGVSTPGDYLNYVASLFDGSLDFAMQGRPLRSERRVQLVESSRPVRDTQTAAKEPRIADLEARLEQQVEDKRAILAQGAVLEAENARLRAAPEVTVDTMERELHRLYAPWNTKELDPTVFREMAEALVAGLRHAEKP